MNSRRTTPMIQGAALAVLLSSAVVAQQGAPRTPQTPAKGAATAPRNDAAAGKATQKGNAVPPKPVVDPEAVRKMEELLARWEKQSKQVRSLRVTYHRLDYSPLFEAKKEYQGQARLKSPDFVYLDFYELVNGEPKTVAEERIVCDGKEVFQFMGTLKRVFIFPLGNDPREKTLNQGPLPFLFDMTAAKAKQRYEMEYRGEDETAYAIIIRPKLALDRQEFSQAWMKLDKTTFLPLKLKLWSPEGNDTKTFTFNPSAIGINEESKKDMLWFDGNKMTDDLVRVNRWVAIRNPKPEDMAPQAAANPNPRNNGAGANAPARGNAAGPVGARPAAKGSNVRQK